MPVMPAADGFRVAQTSAVLADELEFTLHVRLAADGPVTETNCG